MKKENLFKSSGLKSTPIRNEVLSVFFNSEAALSNQDIEAKLDSIDRTTLYRTLKAFEEKGIIHKAIDGTSTPKFALCSHTCTEHIHHDQHVHFHCNYCNNTFCVDEAIIPQVPLPAGFVEEETEMIVKGKCQNCK
jgi:Fur family ferric uptake transcriptional regulator